MKTFQVLAALTAVAFSNTSFAVDGATAPYNEAVTIVNGKRVVEVQPFPRQLVSMLEVFRKPSDPLNHVDTVEEVETPQGLMDCADTPYYHPKACEPSSFGKVKRMREWAVKLHGTWQLCIGREAPTACMPLVMDGKLRSLPTAPLE